MLCKKILNVESGMKYHTSKLACQLTGSKDLRRLQRPFIEYQYPYSIANQTPRGVSFLHTMQVSMKYDSIIKEYREHNVFYDVVLIDCSVHT
jgi:hypothetical protein